MLTNSGKEWLLKEPCFNLAWIDLYLWQLRSRPELIKQVHTLDIWSRSNGRVTRDERNRICHEYPKIKAATVLENTRFLPHFLSVLKNAKDERVISQIEEDVLPLLFCYLVVSLPGLRERKLGGAWLMDFPIFECGLSSALGRMYLPGDWRNSFSLSTYKNLLSQLTVLDVPADMTAMHFAQSARTVFDSSAYPCEPSKNSRTRLPAKPHKIFPPTLQILRISEASQTTPHFLCQLAIAKKYGSHLPALVRVEAYFESRYKAYCHNASSRSPARRIIHIPKLFKDAHIALLLYFPPLGFSHLARWRYALVPSVAPGWTAVG
ncbi:hypothetical protein IAQ61_006687 [Plenodomus lingam]|uniref:uncharacterized protein n=1 Tax=Leptosphaeria maculans TaxID=5022 RepID=UPI00331C02BF|nr:hypothetical protein IAQ61_006687 [Plenodomus lingam]